MKVLDRYLVRELFIPIFYCCLSLVFLTLIADLFDNLDDLLKHDTSFWIIVRYYASLVPYAFTQTLPWAAWMGTLFLLVHLGFHNELTAMKAAGLEMMMIVRPILFLGFLIGIVSFLVSDRVVSKTYRFAFETKQTHIQKQQKQNEPKREYENVTYYSKGNQITFFRFFSLANGEASGVVLLWLDEDQRSTRQKMVATKARWVGETWEFEGVHEYQMDSAGKILGEPVSFTKKTYPDIKFTPRDIASSSMDAVFLTYKELKTSIKKLKENGVRVDSETVDLQDRLAAPWKALIMMLIAIPFLARTTNRKAIALNVLLCVGAIFAYHVFGAVSLALGKAGKIFPFLSAWSANVAFGTAAIVYLEKANH